MATLTETAYMTRKTIKYGAIFLVVFFILRFIWGITVSIYKKINPPKPAAPTVSFRVLPAIKFPKKDLPKLTYSLETIQGTLPSLPNIATVYFMPKSEAKLFSSEGTKDIARRMGFTGNPRQAAETTLFFETGGVPNTTLGIDIATHNFVLNYDFVNDQTILAERKLPSDEQAVSEAKSFLGKASLLTESLSQGTGKVSYWKLKTPDLIPAISLSEAEFVRVDLFRKNLKDLPILTVHPKESLVYFLLSGSRSATKRIVRAAYNHYPIDEEISGTYPLKTVNNAWQELVSGGGFVANLGNNSEGKITVRKAYLAYFEEGQEQNFLQPIFVFEGDNDFVAYVPAVDPEWVE